MQICCRFCTLSKRQIAPPIGKENGQSLALRNRRKAARKVQLKLARSSLIGPQGSSHSLKSALPADEKDEIKVKKWSQRARRRAGKVKARLLRAGLQEGIDAIPMQIEHDTAPSSKPDLPRYASRMKAQGDDWASSLSKAEMSKHGKEAIRMLRGDHLLTSGIGRGGFVGPVDAASPIVE